VEAGGRRRCWTAAVALRRGVEGVAGPRRIRAVRERCWSGWFGSRRGGGAAPCAGRGGSNGDRRGHSTCRQ